MMFLPSCKEMSERVSSGEFEGASFLMRFLVRVHLSMCGHCERYARQIKHISQAVREKAERSVDLDRLAVLKKRIIGRLAGWRPS